MKRYISLIVSVLFAMAITSCEDEKTYSGPEQVAFEKASYSAITLKADQTYELKVQLISASKNNREITVNVALSGTGLGTVVNQVDVPTSVKIKAGEYSTVLPVKLLYAGAGSSPKTVILTLSASDVKVSETLKVATLSVKK
jgi:hypothetical protein